MSILERKPSGVYINEVDLSSIITSESASRAAIIIVSKQGPLEPTYVTTADQFIDLYGNPDAAVSFDHYAALDYFKEGNQLWCKRVAGEGATYSAIVLYSDTSKFGLVAANTGLEDPENIDWNKVLPGGYSNPIAVFYPYRGPGSYANNLAISITTNVVEPFAQGEVTAESINDQGELPAGNYTYQVSKVYGTGQETIVSNPVSVVIASDDQSNAIRVSWELDDKAIGYRVYRWNDDEDGTVGMLAQVGSATSEYVDLGDIVPDADQQPITDSSDALGATNEFTVSIYDMSSNTSTPVETFTCTLGENIDGSGYSTELEDRINPYSQYIRVKSNAVSYELDELPQVNTISQTYLSGGDSGAAPTSYDVAAAWEVFSNKQIYSINFLINSGKANPIVQRAMNSLAEGRGDMFAILDMPSASQRAQQAVDYRKLDLNLNSSYSGIFCPDNMEADNINGKQLYVPPSGWIAALIARTVRVANPSYSFAGLNRGLLDVLSTRYTYTEGEMALLFENQVNYSMNFPGAGIALWEQQTLQSQYSALSWCSVRLMANVLKTSIYNYAIYYVQEPNDEFTERSIISAISGYLQQMQDARAIGGYSAKFTTTAVERDAGIASLAVLIIPTIPISQLIIKFGIGKSSVSVEELLEQLAAS